MSLRIWLTALAVYIMAIAGRTSFGIASPVALDRFDISAAELSLFTVIQLGVYAAAQVPVGLLLDRLGSRRILTAGALILAAGQAWLALAGSYPSALGARVLIGLGDATAFIAVLRLIPQWFAPRQAPMFTQLTGILGQLGQVVSSLPFAFALAKAGWTAAFTALALAGAGMALLAALLVRDKEVATQSVGISEAFRHPGTWLGFWTHFLLGFPMNVFLLLWGVPMMIANGMSEATASALLIVGSIAGIGAGPVLAVLIARHPLRRSWLVLGILALVVAAWSYLLLLPRPIAPVEFAGLLVVLAVCGAGSAIGFDYARTSVPLSRLGSANGIVNQGGFIASLTSAYLIGLVLDWRAPAGNIGRDDFRVAMTVQLVVVAVGLVGFMRQRRRTRERMAQEGTRVPPVREVIDRLRRERRETVQRKERDRKRPGPAAEACEPPARHSATGEGSPRS